MSRQYFHMKLSIHIQVRQAHSRSSNKNKTMSDVLHIVEFNFQFIIIYNRELTLLTFVRSILYLRSFSLPFFPSLVKSKRISCKTQRSRKKQLFSFYVCLFISSTIQKNAVNFKNVCSCFNFTIVCLTFRCSISADKS